MTPRPPVLPVDGCAQDALDRVIADAIGEVVITAYGTPGPQGSKSFKGVRKGKSGRAAPILVESSAKVGPWRDAVKAAALIAMNQARRPPLTGPLAASMVFSLQPPARIPKDRYVDGVPYPAAYPDTSKLVRSTEDALAGVVWLDDAQVVRYTLTEKLYAGYPGALRRPGVVVRVRQIGGAV